MMVIWFAQINNINEIKRSKIIKDLQNLSNDFKNTIDKLNDTMENISHEMSEYNNLFLLGKRG